MNSLKEMQEAVESILPSNCQLTKVEVEGPQVVLYLKNLNAFYEDRNLITKIASKVRKKIVLRSDASMLVPPAEALKTVKKLVPEEAGVTDVRFDS
ncbi:MAG: beta-CASP ribonuclease aCPSF1, partial [Candidatus Norongarragalinales archaeon]